MCRVLASVVFLACMQATPALAQSSAVATELNTGARSYAHFKDDYHVEISDPVDEFAIPIKLERPTFPMYEMRRGRQGWVSVNYLVGPDGRVVDPFIEDSSGSEPFEEAVLATIRDWRFEPVTGGSKQWHTNRIISFVFDTNFVHVNKRFFYFYRDIDRLIEDGNLDEAHDLIENALATMDPSAFELAKIWIAKGRIAAARGDTGEHLRCFLKAGIADGHFLDPSDYPRVLARIVKLQLELGEFSAALENYNKLSNMNTGKRLVSELRPTVRRVEDLIASNKTLAITGHLGADSSCETCGAYWSYRPVRDTFAIDSVSGSVDRIEVRCDTVQQQIDFGPNSTWSIPNQKGNCSIRVFGDEGTVFRLLEKSHRS